ncbi:MAG: phosphoenolpyruvate--protein phosphotransferase [Stygiobacter sp. RIFOXYC12_FULL_38_8]|nr:MAG: phosphoenolpyruvate--protein phosphotransferase [Stygiobacter sp. GWC2_38_9]OGV08270.1 MAG: phosphoenolpyruvate--protein phosphotransferase [Stygiobacter sp. RIFOXYB2_FULL_37_11]OGV09916.1 MAG: phosphoenolpyruvate--protein phosphotransferase [Stygiobacter sp. RIFOXYA2_FULL_38_8]OGV15237.1 MAG: phosphoenolpyruvate--protein phosphotransferase [Stygiobacter sp. RIFOXYC2_FULL_38_25]OGV25117.1 MAG: phosphoenolpyruvate--protein phosphotransferase [Stygiobacter sp. RIFOXYC12_FULL_38_8]OGV7897
MKEREINTVIKGIAAAPGIVIAKAYIYAKEKEEVSNEAITDIDEALNNLEVALEQSKKELKKIFSLAVDKLGEKRAAIFEAQMMILDDPILVSTLKKRIQNEMKMPEFVVDSEISKYTHLMSLADEAYMKERSHDIEDIKHRIIRNLKKKKWRSRIANDVIVVTTNLSPSDTVLFSRVNVKGYVTDFGGLTSHAAILARSLNIPAVVGLHNAMSKIHEDDELIIDGYKGVVVINPDEKHLKEYLKKIDKLHNYDEELNKLKDLPAETRDGRIIQLEANLDLTEELEYLVHNCAQGIGLVRTEQLFQQSEAFPDEEEQFLAYKEIADKVYPNYVTIRTFDIGGDKVLPVDLKEPNPFLGWRGIRLLLDSTDLFKTQIRAILRASSHKNVRLMIPMVTSLEEVRETHKLIDECKKELHKEGKQFDKHMQVGLMIEIPSAAAMAKEFAEESDFLSIGTNDLIQYTLAVDRGNEIVSKLYQEFHPAIVRFIHHVITEGKKVGKRVSLCGEMGADPFAVPLLVGLGLESLSASASILPHIKKVIRSISYDETKELGEKCLKLKTEKEINAEMHAFYNRKMQDQIKNLY